MSDPFPSDPPRPDETTSGPTRSDAMPDVEDDGRPTYPGWGRRFLHLLAFNGLAVAQPLLGLVGSEPQFWIARRATWVDVVVVVFLGTLLLPLLAFAAERLLALISEKAAWLAHLVVLAGFGAVFAVYAIGRLRDVELRGPVVVVIALATGIAVSVVYARSSLVREFVGFLAFLPVVLVAILILNLPDLSGAPVDAVDVGVESDAPVVFMVLDEMSSASMLAVDGSIDRTRFPNLGRLADTSVWYPNATTVHDNTLKSVPAILTGLEPVEGREALASDFPQNLFTVLGATHAMRVDEHVTQLCPTNLCESPESRRAGIERLSVLVTDTGVVFLHSILPENQRYRLPAIGTRWEGFLDGEPTVDIVTDDASTPLGPAEAALVEMSEGESRSAQFGRFIDSFDPELGAALYYLHVDFPHAPWSFVPSGERYGYSDHIPGQSPQGMWLDPWYAQQGMQRYLLLLGYTDLLVGMTLDRLEELDMLEDAMILVVSDHGENFESGEPRRALTEGTLAAMGGVPLFIKYPGQIDGSIDAGNAQTIDVLPTVVSGLGGTITSVDGVSLLDDDRPELKRMLGNSGALFEVALEDYVRMMDEQLTWNEGQFATAAGWDVVFHGAGPRPDLIGSSVATLQVIEREGTVALKMPTSRGEGGLVSVAVPADITVADGDLPQVFAVAVNGTIRAAITAHSVDGRTATIYSVVSPDSYRVGENLVEVFGVTEVDGTDTLVRFS